MSFALLFPRADYHTDSAKWAKEGNETYFNGLRAAEFPERGGGQGKQQLLKNPVICSIFNRVGTNSQST